MIRDLISNFNRKEDKIKPYLEFKSSTPMTITPNYTNSGITLQYSLDKVTWTNIGAKGVTPSAKVIYFRGRATGIKSLFTGSIRTNNWLFTNANNLEVHGDITMLIQDTLGGIVRDIPLGGFAFDNMFYLCTSLTTAPELPTTTLANSCYEDMFFGCTSLTTAPILPATTLADYCYYAMFYGCTNLTTVPALPATTLSTGCYSNMFSGCTKIKISTTKTGSYQTAYRVPTVGTGVNATIAFEYMFDNTGGTFVGTSTINTTYYTENQVI